MPINMNMNMLHAHATTNAAQNDYCDIHLTDLAIGTISPTSITAEVCLK